MSGDRARAGRDAAEATHLSAGRWIAVFAGFAFACLVLFRPALSGELVFDDVAYTLESPLAAEVSVESVAAILDPAGAVAERIGHYAPVALLLHGIAWQVFGDALAGHHVVNVLLHALNATLLVALYLGSGVPRVWSLLGGAFFAVHAANVEAVAWVSQLRSDAALAAGLAALLAYRRRPALGAALFALGLLCNILAAFVLPMALAWAWASNNRPEAGSHRRTWLPVWVLLAALIAVPEVAALRAQADIQVGGAKAWAQVRTVVGVATRYLIMAATTFGLSAFHQMALPPPVGKSWLAGMLVCICLLWRIAATLRSRSLEAGWWLGAVAAIAPVAQLIPFYFPLADRYLYFILPGLIGGTLLFGRDVGFRVSAALSRRGNSERNVRRLSGAAVLALAASILFSFQHAYARAHLWRDDTLLLLDAERHYPAGPVADYLRAARAAGRNELDAAMDALRAATDKGFHRVHDLRSDPRLLTLRPMPSFRALLHELDPISGSTAGQNGAEGRPRSGGIVREWPERASHCGVSQGLPNVLLVTFDTTRRDHLTAYGYDRPTSPHFDRLARAGVRFDHAYAAAPETAPSHASLLTGQYPIGHGLLKNGLTLSEDRSTLAEHLAEFGYENAAFVGSFALDARFGLAQGFSRYDDDFTRGESSDEPEHWEGHLVLNAFDRRANRSLDAVVRWLGNERDAKQPFFLFVHFWDPHMSYDPPPLFRDMFPGSADPSLKPGDVDIDKGIRWYDGEIAFADWALGMLLAELDEQGLADDTLVVVTADHGEGLMQRGILTHSFHVYDEEVGVPLVMRWPRCLPADRVVKEPVELVDVLPTVLDLIGVDASTAEIHGKSHAPALRGEGGFDPERPVFLHRRAHDDPFVDKMGGVEPGGEIFGVRRGRWKYIERAQPARRELFDLESDPAERHNRVSEHADVATELSGLIAAWRRAHAREPDVPQSVSPADRAILRELGYVD